MKLTTGYRKYLPDSDSYVLLAGGGHKNISQIINDYGVMSISPAWTFSSPISGDLLGNATTADRLKSSTTIGGSTTPVYFANGVPVACTAYSSASVNSATYSSYTYVSNHTSDNADYYMTWAVGYDALRRIYASSNGVKYNPSTTTLKVPNLTVSGTLTGTLTGSCSGSSGSCTGNAATATTATMADYTTRLASTAVSNKGGLNYYYLGGSTSSNDATGSYSGYSSSTTYNSVLRLLSHTTAGALYYVDLIFDINSDNIGYRRVTNSGTPSLRKLAFIDSNMAPAPLTVTSIASIPVTNQLVIATISASASFSLATTNLVKGNIIHVIIKNSSTSSITVTIPTASPYVNLTDSTLTVDSSSYAEVNCVYDGTNIYLRAI